MKAIYFDMDGTIADFYSRRNRTGLQNPFAICANFPGK